MASAPTLPLVSVEEYLRTGYEHDMEFADGVLIERGIPTPAHSALQTIVAVQHLFSFRKQLHFGVM